MRIKFLFLFLIFTAPTFAQYPFEKFLEVKYSKFHNWKEYGNYKSKKIDYTLSIPEFFDNKDTLYIQLTSFPSIWDSSYIRLFRNHTQIQKIFEPAPFYYANIDSVRIADINGDSLNDIKLIIPYMGNGIASLNVRVIYLFQNKTGKFERTSFFDKQGSNSPERDFNGDGNFEIITMKLNHFNGHSYWTFNLFNYQNGNLVSVNDVYDYPIMIQFLYRDNYEITNKISKIEMKKFGLKEPEEYLK